jgi:methenyltetrahydromethanopterin cyclohydrolase
MPEAALQLNARAVRAARRFAEAAAELRIGVSSPAGACVLDAGVSAPGGLAAGLALARLCTADLAEVALVPGELAGVPTPWVHVHTDHPVAACMASQYAGWQVAVGKFFAMGSGPMRAAAGREPLFERLGLRESPSAVAGVLEGRRIPDEAVISLIAEKTRVDPSEVTLAVAPTASIAGGVQVVARSAETALHKLFELGFDLTRVVSASGAAPLPPPARDDLAAIGRTNDAILYAGRVVLWVRGDDESLIEVGPKVPSSAGRGYGAPFAEIFEAAGRDFYKIDPLLFSPAEIVFRNLDTGRSHHFGRSDPQVAARSLHG